MTEQEEIVDIGNKMRNGRNKTKKKPRKVSEVGSLRMGCFSDLRETLKVFPSKPHQFEAAIKHF